ncbi:glycosyltransferase family 2 protein [Rhizobium puerariae]|uniref:Glycosyltransferase family 2 protein n=1 Tax=Rhizobium puerariae TaxID=1585791 RepID=A0ABV6AV90_9HYPH
MLRWKHRERGYVLLRLSALDAPLDPKFYLKRGNKYREENAIPPPENTHFIFIIDRSKREHRGDLRFDPCSFVTSFELAAEEFNTRHELESAVGRFLNENAETHVQEVSWEAESMISRWIRRFRKTYVKQSVKSHARALYRQAGIELADVVAIDETAIWLSIVTPVYNTPPRYLDDLLASYLQQGITGTELILSDDASTSPATIAWLGNCIKAAYPNVRVVRSLSNGGISKATNLGISQAKGAWIGFLDHDDLIAPSALKSIYKGLSDNPDAKFLYTDTLLVEHNLTPRRYILKPAFDPIMLTGMNYINHFSIFRSDRIARTGLLRSDLDGSQDYDFLLRYLEDLDDSEVLHMPYPAYWWRRHKKSFSQQHMQVATANARKALVDHFSRLGQSVVVGPADTDTFHKVNFAPGANTSLKVSIIIPNRNSYELISSLLEDLYKNTKYSNFEVIIVDNGSTDERVLETYKSYIREHGNFFYDITEEAFNFARSINKGIAKASGELLLLLNNDVEVIDPNWLIEMVSCFEYENVGIVGAKLLYPDDTLQHAGVIVGFGGLAGHWYHRKPKDFGGHTNRLHVRNAMTCVTAAVMMVSRNCAEVVGAWDEENFAVAYNDVDYCIRAHNQGFRIIWTPFSCLYHHESVSRGSDRSPANRARFEREKANLKRLHGTGAYADPASNPFFSVNSSEPQLRLCEPLPKTRRWFR